jgi:anthranilate phosphoribosyltransferase
VPENRRLEALACAQQAIGDWKSALDAARAAEAIDSGAAAAKLEAWAAATQRHTR